MTGGGRLAAALIVAAPLALGAGEGAAQPDAARMIAHMDADGDGRIARAEFLGPPWRFKQFDRDGDGYATRAEIEAVLGAAGAPGSGAAPAGRPGQAGMGALDDVTRGAFLMRRVREQEIARGLIEGTLIPVYPAGASCPQIDHVFGEYWQGPVHLRQNNATRHHGADIPAPYGTPILAVADGVVVAEYSDAASSFRGYEIVLRHAPADSGLPVWLYTSYAHFVALPELQIGQRVRMGEPLGATGKSGVSSESREDHLHIGVVYSVSDRYVPSRNQIVPVDGHYADVVTLMRRRMPLDTNAMRALPEAERRVAIPHRLTTGATVPPDTRIIWPYACRPD